MRQGDREGSVGVSIHTAGLQVDGATPEAEAVELESELGGTGQGETGLLLTA